MDSESENCLDPEDANKFSYFLIGGILGNGIAIYSNIQVILLLSG